MLEFNACITSIENNELIFDATCFYPGGGNQLHDIGVVFAAGKVYKVIRVYEKEQLIHHVLEDACDLKVGDSVQCVVDKERRKYTSALHTAQHVISRIVFNKYKLNTVSIDMTLEGGTIAFSAPLAPHWIDAIREEFSHVAAAEMPITNEIKGDLVTVNIGDYDSVLCGGTHLSNTRELNVVMINGLGRKNNILSFDVFSEFGKMKESLKDFYDLRYMLGLEKNIVSEITTIIDNYNEIWDEMYEMCKGIVSAELLKNDNVETVNGFKVAFVQLSGAHNTMKFYRKIVKKTDYNADNLDICVFSLDNQYCIEAKTMAVDAKRFFYGLKDKGISIEKGGGSGRKVDILTGSEYGAVKKAIKEILGET